MPRERRIAHACFPLDEARLGVVLTEPRSTPEVSAAALTLDSGHGVEEVRVVDGRPWHLELAVAPMEAVPLTIDTLVVDGEPTGMSFVHGILNPMELKLQGIEDGPPFESTLVGLGVSVACCTGCNGGIHDRGLVVINGHVAGPWTGLWVQTDTPIPTPYPRWQRTLFAGGVVREVGGSTTVRDEGWMDVRRLDEDPHHAPAPLRIDAADLPGRSSASHLAKGMDAAWVELTDLEVISARRKKPTAAGRLPHNQIHLRDQSGATVEAWMYQKRGLALRAGERISRMRAFVHAEGKGGYVLLSDKDEDLRVA